MSISLCQNIGETGFADTEVTTTATQIEKKATSCMVACCSICRIQECEYESESRSPEERTEREGIDQREVSDNKHKNF